MGFFLFSNGWKTSNLIVHLILWWEVVDIHKKLWNDLKMNILLVYCETHIFSRLSYVFNKLTDFFFFRSLFIRFQNSFHVRLRRKSARIRKITLLQKPFDWVWLTCTHTHTHVHIPLSVTTAVILCFLCYHQSRCSRSISLARVSGHMVLTHRLQLMPIVFDMLWLLYSRCGRRTCPKHLSGLFCTFWFSYFPLCDCCASPRQTSRWVRVTKSICVMNLWQTVWFTCCSAVKNLALTKWTPYISECLFLPVFLP